MTEEEPSTTSSSTVTSSSSSEGTIHSLPNESIKSIPTFVSKASLQTTATAIVSAVTKVDAVKHNAEDITTTKAMAVKTQEPVASGSSEQFLQSLAMKPLVSRRPYRSTAKSVSRVSVFGGRNFAGGMGYAVHKQGPRRYSSTYRVGSTLFSQMKSTRINRDFLKLLPSEIPQIVDHSIICRLSEKQKAYIADGRKYLQCGWNYFRVKQGYLRPSVSTMLSPANAVYLKMHDSFFKVKFSDGRFKVAYYWPQSAPEYERLPFEFKAGERTLELAAVSLRVVGGLHKRKFNSEAFTGTLPVEVSVIETEPVLFSQRFEETVAQTFAFQCPDEGDVFGVRVVWYSGYPVFFRAERDSEASLWLRYCAKLSALFGTHSVVADICDKGPVHLKGDIKVKLGTVTQITVTIVGIQPVDGFGEGKLKGKHLISQRISRLPMADSFDGCHVFANLRLTASIVKDSDWFQFSLENPLTAPKCGLKLRLEFERYADGVQCFVRLNEEAKENETAELVSLVHTLCDAQLKSRAVIHFKVRSGVKNNSRVAVFKLLQSQLAAAKSTPVLEVRICPVFWLPFSRLALCPPRLGKKLKRKKPADGEWLIGSADDGQTGGGSQKCGGVPKRKRRRRRSVSAEPSAVSGGTVESGSGDLSLTFNSAQFKGGGMWLKSTAATELPRIPLMIPPMETSHVKLESAGTGLSSAVQQLDATVSSPFAQMTASSVHSTDSAHVSAIGSGAFQSLVTGETALKTSAEFEEFKEWFEAKCEEWKLQHLRYSFGLLAKHMFVSKGSFCFLTEDSALRLGLPPGVAIPLAKMAQSLAKEMKLF